MHYLQIGSDAGEVPLLRHFHCNGVVPYKQHLGEEVVHKLRESVIGIVLELDEGVERARIGAVWVVSLLLLSHLVDDREGVYLNHTAFDLIVELKKFFGRVKVFNDDRE